jgi:hypothetical protein
MGTPEKTLEKKRYQVFISSTFEDLKEERRAVQDVVISTGDFPVQMESFPAADKDQFEFIKTLIDDCDYYVLIIAGRYGSTDGDDGLSYTHKEFRYAVSRGVPILVMLHGALDKIEVGKSETGEDRIARLRDFIEEAQTKRLRKTWTNLEGLKLAVREALDHAKATKPRVGWVRGNSLASVAALEELNEVRKENEAYRKTIGALEIELDLPPIPAPDDRLVINLLPHTTRGSSRRGSAAGVSTSWIEAFPIFHNNLKWRTTDWNNEYSYYVEEEDSCVEIGSAIAAAAVPVDAAYCFKIARDTLTRLMNYYIEAGLMRPVGADVPFTEIADKVARRHSIAQRQSKAFEVVHGSVEVGETFSRDLDEIPF